VAVVGIGWTPNSPTERQGLLCEMTDTSLPHAFLRSLLLNEGDEEVPPSSGGGFGGGEFDPKVFWSVNAFIVVLLIGSCAWCYCYGGGKAFCLGSMNRTQSDQEYQRAVLQRRQREAEQTKDSPEKRKRKLAQSFQRNQVGMIVQEGDIIESADDDREDNIAALPSSAGDESNAIDKVSGPQNAMENNNNTSQVSSSSVFGPIGADVEAGLQGYLRLRHESDPARNVPNICAICLGEYELGEKVVWSSNRSCLHAFHAACIVDWLTKMQDGTPCPCCRQSFTDLEEYRKERRITWQAGAAFNPRAIAFR
jgi:hypothetical protein